MQRSHADEGSWADSCFKSAGLSVRHTCPQLNQIVAGNRAGLLLWDVAPHVALVRGVDAECPRESPGFQGSDQAPTNKLQKTCGAKHG